MYTCKEIISEFVVVVYLMDEIVSLKKARIQGLTYIVVVSSVLC